MPVSVNETYLVPPGQPIPGALFYGSSFTVLASYADATIVVHDTMPVSSETGVSSDTVVRRPVAILKLSPQALKEFSEIIVTAVAQYEHAYGEIQVDFFK